MWRKVRKEDVKRGLMIRITGMKDTAFNGAVVLGTFEVKSEWADRVAGFPDYTFVRIARPMAYASAHWDSKQPNLHCEVFEMDFDRMCAEDTDIEVYEDSDGKCHYMMLAAV
jgi:hypothetical protein